MLKKSQVFLCTFIALGLGCGYSSPYGDMPPPHGDMEIPDDADMPPFPDDMKMSDDADTPPPHGDMEMTDDADMPPHG